MPTNLKIDDQLLNLAMKLGKLSTKKETVSVALQEYIQRHKQQDIVKLFGKIDYDPSYDYKAQRRKS